jgi:hypothetical protein
MKRPALSTLPVSRRQIDHRGSHTTTQPTDRTGKTPFQQGQQGEHLAADPVRCGLAAASPHFHVGLRSIWPIEI